MATLLDVRGLKTTFATSAGQVRAVDGVSWDVQEGETVALVGESGCGKSVSALSIMQLIDPPAGRIESGEIIYKGRDLLKLPKEEMRKLRGDRIAMIFQEPMTSLNPVLRVGDQIAESYILHKGADAAAANARAVDLLRKVGIPSPEKRVRDYPHQFSGGMRQRAMIAMALACGPDVLIADEPTTALDVTIQAQILELLKDLQRELKMALVLITHNIGVVAEMADDVVVMYAGRAVEKSPVFEAFKDPRHPYTRPPGLGALHLPAQGPPVGHRRPAARPLRRAPRLPVRAALRRGPAAMPHRRPAALLSARRPHGQLLEGRSAGGGRVSEGLLDVRGLTKHFEAPSETFFGPKRRVAAVDGISFTVNRGDTFGLVGESGCGKTTLGGRCSSSRPRRPAGVLRGPRRLQALRRRAPPAAAEHPGRLQDPTRASTRA